MVSQTYPLGAAELLTSSYARRPNTAPTTTAAAAAMHQYRRGVPSCSSPTVASPLASPAGVGLLHSLPPHQLPSPLLATDPPQPKQRSPMLCGYPSKKCWSWRVEKRNGELHKFCEYHRQKANTNQRRMEQRRKLGQGKPRSARASSAGDCKAERRAPEPLKVECTRPVKAETAAGASGSPRGVDLLFDTGAPAMDATAAYSWMDVELDVGLDAAVGFMLLDPAAIDMEPSDKPVDLYEEDLFFLEHFIDEIAHSAV